MRLLAFLVLALSLVASGCGSSGGSAAAELLPDLDQVAPRAVSVRTVAGDDLLVFVSAVENVGAGDVVIEAERDDVAEPMEVRQVIERGDGSEDRRLVSAALTYVRAETHSHWHLEGFERYELRSEDGEPLGRDRKTGFCLGDRYERTSLDLDGKPEDAVFTGECGKGEPTALSVREGISPGYGDDYVPLREGQHIDVTGLAPGRYVLVHTVDPDGDLRESDRANNSASAVVELAREGGRLTARLVRACEASAECA